MSSLLECNYCKKTFSVKGSLTLHQKTAKYCLILQGKKNENNYECDFCVKKFTLKQSLQEHLLICKKKPTIELNKELVEKEKQYQKLV